MFEDSVHFMTATELVIENQKVVKSELRYEIILQHTHTHKDRSVA